MNALEIPSNFKKFGRFSRPIYFRFRIQIKYIENRNSNQAHNYHWNKSFFFPLLDSDFQHFHLQLIRQIKIQNSTILWNFFICYIQTNIFYRMLYLLISNIQNRFVFTILNTAESIVWHILYVRTWILKTKA